jgi:hypothetical protein
MNIIKKYRRKRKLTDIIYKEFEKSLKDGDYQRACILSHRLLKLKI